MNDAAHNPGGELANASREEIMAALFANMVIQQANMGMMFLGKTPHPETGEFIRDLETARMFIDQLEMLEAKTKGNLSRQEEALLKRGLGELRMAFVEAVEESPARAMSPKAEPQQQRPAPPKPESPAIAPAPAASTPAAPPPEESRKKFTKKY